MHPGVVTVVDAKRGCGFRSPGGFYLRSDPDHIWESCGCMPLELGICEHCGQGIVATRAMREVSVPSLFDGKECDDDTRGEKDCGTCPVNTVTRAFLMTVGEKFYPTPQHFMREAFEEVGGKPAGISKRIPKSSTTGMPLLPKSFRVGQSWILLSHKSAVVDFVPGKNGKMQAEEHEAIFAMFRPARIEYVITGNEDDAFLDELMERGITPVYVIVDGGDGKQIPLVSIEDAVDEDV